MRILCVSSVPKKLHAPLHFGTIIAGVWHLTTPSAPPREIQSPKTMNILGAGIHAQLRKTFRMKVNFPFPS